MTKVTKFKKGDKVAHQNEPTLFGKVARVEGESVYIHFPRYRGSVVYNAFQLIGQ